MPVKGRPVDVRGRDEAVLCPAFIAVAVRNDVPGFGADARISVSNGSSKKVPRTPSRILISVQTRCAKPVVILNANEKHHFIEKNSPNYNMTGMKEMIVCVCEYVERR